VPDWLGSVQLCATNTFFPRRLLGSNFAALNFNCSQIPSTTQNPKAEGYGMREDRSAWGKKKRYERRAEQSRNISKDDDIAASGLAHREIAGGTPAQPRWIISWEESNHALLAAWVLAPSASVVYRRLAHLLQLVALNSPQALSVLKSVPSGIDQ